MGAVPHLPFGLATSPGEVPAADLAPAVELAVRDCELPTVPVLSAGGCSLVDQVVDSMEGVSVLPDGRLLVDTGRFGVRPDVAAATDGPGHAALVAFLERWPALVVERPGLAAVRVELAGPVSVCLWLYAAGVPMVQALDAARVVCTLRAEALLAAVRQVERRRPVAVVMREPRLVGAMHPTFPLSVRQVRSLLDPVVDVLDRAADHAPVLIGVHVPGRSDWPTIISSGVSFLSLPPDPALVEWSPAVQAMLDNGGFVAWGAVPVDRPLGTNAELLWRHLSAVWSDLVFAGVDPTLLRSRSLVSTADGLGRFAPEQLGRVRALLVALGERVRDTTFGSRRPARA